MKFSICLPPGVGRLYHSFEADASLKRFCHLNRTVLSAAGISAKIVRMKTVTRIVLVAAIAGGIYFATIGRDQFYDLLDFFYEIIAAVAGGYLKK
jgi:hypothetical protein